MRVDPGGWFSRPSLGGRVGGPGMCRCDPNVVETDLLGLAEVQAMLQTLSSPQSSLGDDS